MRFGARRVLFAGLLLGALGALLAGLAQSYAMLVVAAAVGGLGDGVFHPCDFADACNARGRAAPPGLCVLLARHRRVSRLRRGAGVRGGDGGGGSDWRGALVGAAAVGLAVTGLLWLERGSLYVSPADRVRDGARAGLSADLRVLASAPVLMCFGYFVLVAVAFVAMQNFGVAALAMHFGASTALASSALTAYLLGAAAGIFAGGFVAARTSRHELVADRGTWRERAPHARARGGVGARRRVAGPGSQRRGFERAGSPNRFARPGSCAPRRPRGRRARSMASSIRGSTSARWRRLSSSAGCSMPDGPARCFTPSSPPRLSRSVSCSACRSAAPRRVPVVDPAAFEHPQ
ncbi:MAG: hypothetical protein RML56_05470 [Burkholderiales bacterium]|nr:hypothetical protein [Burkholderiales bacterium]